MKNKNFIWSIILFTFVIGCVLPLKKPSEKPTAPLEEKEKLIQDYLQKGQAYENQGKLIEASKQYKLALTVDARNPSAIEKNRRIENQLRILAEKYYQEGLNFHEKGKYDLARRKFLMTLRHWPNHSGALEMIRPRKQVPAQNYIVHTIKAGESISQLAKLYYGDYHKFPIIAEYNNLKNATKVYVSQKIKVPQVEGLPFLVKKDDIQAEDIYPRAKPKKNETVKDEKKETPVEIEEQTRYRDLGIELFKKKQYLESTLELLKALNANPDDQTTRGYLYQSNFNWAMEFFEKKDYLTAKKKFETASQYKEHCSECQDFIKKCEEAYTAAYQESGITLFKNKKYPEAISEFNKIFKTFSDDKTTREYIYQSYFGWAVELYEKKDYLTAKKKFETASQYKEYCSECQDFIKKCEENYKEIHYNLGIQYFGKENLAEAIKEWECVYAEDTEYKEVTYNLNKARGLLRKLEEIKKSLQEQEAE